MIDFTNVIRKNKTFNGASGNKLSIVYNKESYMLSCASLHNGVDIKIVIIYKKAILAKKA